MRHLIFSLSSAVFLFSAGAFAETYSFGASEGGGPVYAAMTAISKAAGTHENLDIRIQPFRGTGQYIPITNAGELSGGLANAMQLLEAYRGEGIFDGDSPTQFKSKLDRVMRTIRVSRARTQYALKNSKDWKNISLQSMETILQDEQDRFMDELGATDEAWATMSPEDRLDAQQKARARMEVEYGWR